MSRGSVPMGAEPLSHILRLLPHPAKVVSPSELSRLLTPHNSKERRMYHPGKLPARIVGVCGNVTIVPDKMYQWKAPDHHGVGEDDVFTRIRRTKQRRYDRYLCEHSEDE